MNSNTEKNVRLVGAGLVPAHIKGKTQKGITLIAVVITIIVLLILAGVTISMVLGDDGIIQNAQAAKQATKDAAIQEEINKISMEKGMKEHGLSKPETLPTSIDGVITRLVEKGIRADESEIEVDEENKTIKYKDGSKLFSLAGLLGSDDEPPSNPYIASYTEDNIPIPVGFEGVKNDEGEYYTEDEGFVITDGTNEFVWVPVDDTTGWTEPGIEPSDGNGTTDNINTEYASMKASVDFYNGFYVGRYETNYLYGSTPGYPMDDLDWYTFYTGMKGLYPDSDSNETGVVSGMIHDGQWDAIMDWMSDVPNIIDPTKLYINDGTGMGYYYDKYTGKDPAYAVKNIYDLAGSVHEYTQTTYR